MENLSHTLSALVLARMGGDRDGPWATALLVTAANFPDVDGLSLFSGKEAYLVWHHGITHSVVGVLAAAPLLGWLFWLVARRRGHAVKLQRFVLLAFLGLVVHCGLDAAISYGMRPWLPFDDRWFYGDLVYVADPWVWVIFGAGSLLGGKRTGGGWWAWVGLALVTVVAAWVAVGWGRVDAPVPWLLLLAWATVLGLRWRGFGEGRRRPWAVLAATVLVVYFAGLATVGARNRNVGVAALIAHHSIDPTTIETSSLMPRCGSPLESTVIVQTRDWLYRARLRWGAEVVATGEPPLPRQLGEVPQIETRSPSSVAVWRSFARHGFVGRDEKGWILGDARYAWGVRDAWCNLRVPAEGVR